MNGTDNDDFVIAFKGSTGTDNNTVYGNGGDDLVIGDSSDTWIPNAAYLNGSIGTAFNLETLTSTWTTAENPMFGDATIPHSTVMCETTIGQSEYFRIAIGAGQKITIDIDFGSSTPIGNPKDLVVELQDSLGNIIAFADDSNVSDGGQGSLPDTPGSTASSDPYLVYTVASAGIYYINVRPYGGPGTVFDDNNTFVMNLSVSGHAVSASNPVQGADSINGGDGDDTLFGQGGGDVINGDGGNDFIDGGSGGDIIHGGEGDDIVYGGDGTEENAHGDNGNDILHSGGEGHYYGDAGNDTIYAGLTSGVNEVLDGGTGTDTLDTTTWNGSYIVNLVTGTTNFNESFTNFENIVTGNGNDTITGTTGDNVITTQGGSDTVNADAGNDVVAGGANGDALDGGAGTDLLDYSGSLAGVSVSLAANTATGGDATGDTIANFENVNGSAGGNDALIGNSGANVLKGLGGDDTLNGGGGDDVLSGGTGNDLYVVDSTGDVVKDFAGDGTDTVKSSVDWMLGAETENLTLTGSADLNGTGNIGANIITGNAGANVLNGLGGSDTLYGGANDDTLNGGAGDDTLNGGSGNDVINGAFGDDTYVVDSTGDVINDVAGQGTDTVKSTVDWMLGAETENLTLTGSADLNGAGNDGANIITGNAGANVLNGLAGDDTIGGGGDSDTIKGGGGNDTLVYNAVSDSRGANCDTIVSFDFNGADHFDLNVTVTGIDAAFGAGETLSQATFVGDLAAAIGAGQLAAHHAVLFTPTGGDLAGSTFLVVDANGTDGYQASGDYVFNLVAPAHLGVLDVTDFV